MCVCALLGGTLYVCLCIARGNIVCVFVHCYGEHCMCVCALLGGTLYVCLYIARGNIVCVFVHC